jgi:predicted nucleotide-binding protein
LEMGLLKKLLEERSIQPVEAGGYRAPAQNAFCAKICSKIITSQFCIALLNNDEKSGTEIPNANVNMEYGLMLGFNKYVIPFQRETQKLPFNIAGLDTIKYDNKNFADEAVSAIDQAINETNQNEVPKDTSDQMVNLFILSRNFLW